MILKAYLAETVTIAQLNLHILYWSMQLIVWEHQFVWSGRLPFLAQLLELCIQNEV